MNDPEANLSINQPPENRTNISGAELTQDQSHPIITKVFIGPAGLRSGWRFVIYLIAFGALLSAILFILRPVLPFSSQNQGSRLWPFLFGECVSLVSAVVPALVISRFENRPFGIYGLPPQLAFRKHFWSGMLWGIVAISALLVVMRGVGVFSFEGFALHGIRILKFAAFWGVLFLVVGLFEEFVTRGYTQFILTQGMGFWPAAFLLSIGFGAIHLGNPGEAWVGGLGAACIGLFFCLTLRRTGTLWFAVGMHASWDWGETFFYSVPDSGLVAPGHLMKSSLHGSRWLTGGSVGPEGSVLVFVIIAALWILFDRLYPEAKYGHQPQVVVLSEAGLSPLPRD